MCANEASNLISKRIAITGLLLVAWMAAAQPDVAQAKAPVKRGRATAANDKAQADAEGTDRTIDDALEFAQGSRKALDSVRDYTATFTKWERVNQNAIEQTMDIKCRQEPFSVYLRNKTGNEEGREVLFVTGANNGQLLARDHGLLGSLAGTVSLKLDDPLVQKENRYPITDIGIAKITDKSLAIWGSEKKANPKNLKVRFTEAKVEGTSCDVVEVIRNRSLRNFPYSLSRVYFAQDSKLPVRAEQYGWPARAGQEPPLLEMYQYTNLKTNVGLTDADFDPRNPAYAFGGN